MINTSFIHAYDDEAKAEALYMEEMSDINAIMAPVRAMERKRNEMLSIGIYEESADEYFTESVKDAVTKLGQKIIEIVNRIKEFIKGIPAMFQNGKWSKSNIDEKLDMIKKNDPKRYNELKVYVDKGSLDFASMRTMTEYYKNVDALLDELRKKETDEKSLKGKLAKVKNTIHNNKETVAEVAAILGLVATATGIYMNVRNFKKDKAKAIDAEITARANKMSDRAKNMEELSKSVQKMIDQNEKDPEKNKIPYLKQRILAEAAADLERLERGGISKLTSLKLKLFKGVDSLAQKVGKADQGNDAFNRATDVQVDLLSKGKEASDSSAFLHNRLKAHGVNSSKNIVKSGKKKDKKEKKNEEKD